MNRSLNSFIAFFAILLPTVSLIVLGGLWIWQNGYLLTWAVAACVVTLICYLLLLWLSRRRFGNTIRKIEIDEINPTSEIDNSWTALEKKAWEEVITIAANVQPEQLSSRTNILILGQEVIVSVSRKLHPEVEDPLLKFTVPEALLLSERVCNRLRSFVLETIPLGDQLTVAQIARLYHWRFLFETLDQGYNIWRVFRLLNPLTAATHEMREQVSRKMYEWGRDEFARRLAQRYVKEVGRSAIDLYSGRLRVTAGDLTSHVTKKTQRDRDQLSNQFEEPLRIITLGSVSAGKSSLINALFDEIRAAVDVIPVTPLITPYELKKDGLPAAILLDSPGLTNNTKLIDELISEAAHCDMILWVLRADRADREIDRIAIERIRATFAKLTERKQPPLLFILSHVDRLRPFQEWNPPYDVIKAESEKAATIFAVMQTVASDLNVPIEDIIPASFSVTNGTYNIDALWARILDTLPEAKSSQLVRCLRDSSPGFEWTKLWSQAVSAGRVIARTVID